MSAVNPLSAEFLYELYATALRQEPLCAVLARHMRKEYLPDRSFQQVQEAIAVHFKTTRHRRRMPCWHRPSMRITTPSS